MRPLYVPFLRAGPRITEHTVGTLVAGEAAQVSWALPDEAVDSELLVRWSPGFLELRHLPRYCVFGAWRSLPRGLFRVRLTLVWFSWSSVKGKEKLSIRSREHFVFESCTCRVENRR